MNPLLFLPSRNVNMEMKVIGIEEILKRGFSLMWMESHCSLSLYGESGGKCGFDESIALTGLTQLSALLVRLFSNELTYRLIEI